MIVKIDKKVVVYAILGIIFACVLGWLGWITTQYFFNINARNQTELTEHSTWMTVFVHGSFGSLLSFLSFSDVLHDKVSGSLYHATTKKMRADDVFFKDQPLLQRGLVPFTPTFDLAATNNKKYVVYPIAAAYQMITNNVRKGKENNLFYAFGWSGLISQSSRRFEAVRFYNALHRELESLRSQGMNPKLRIIAHSHGGNLSLNLAAINSVLNQTLWTKEAISSNDPIIRDRNEALHKMAEIIKELPAQEIAAQHRGQKALDYVPIGRNMVVDELILFGVPIQPETEVFCYSDTFKRIYNFYSYEDIVQKMDWLTSKKPLSNQRIRDLRPRKDSKQQTTSVIQAQIMIDREEQDLKPISTLRAEPTVIDEVADGRNIFVRTSKDPTHKELWFVSWKNNNKSDLSESTSALMPLPIMVLTPLLQRALELSQETDVRLNIHTRSETMSIDIIGKRCQKNVLLFQYSLIDEIIYKLMPWKPENISPEKELDAILKHLP